MQIQQFYTGKAFDAYTFFGAHPYDGGVRFRVWADGARAIEVVGSWNNFQPVTMYRNFDNLGPAIWGLDCGEARVGDTYLYRVHGADGSVVDHCDPYGFAMTLRPDGHSVIAGLPDYPFTDGDWMARRTRGFDAPLNLYEVQLGSWQRDDPDQPLTYDELADRLPAYAKAHGYTHIELMPLAEYPFDGSWGYQTTGFYAPTSRYGTPAGLCKLVDACHAAGIGVVLDFVPVHFAVDDYGLKRFDGTPLYEYPAAAVGESEWGSCNFMHSRGEIRAFLQSCADYWLRCFHFDGLRMDAVSRLIYWQGDPARGVNGTTLEFVKGMNQGLRERHPTAMLIAEDSTNYPKVTAPVEYGGLGFDYKWDLGWMNDTLDYFRTQPLGRKYNFNKLTFSMMYFWNEHYILPFSHDENVHGKATILQKMYGDYDGKFPQGRLLYLYMAAHPGKMLDFMGNEFGQLREYDESREQDWEILKYPLHDGFRQFRTAMHEVYLAHDAFWKGEYDPARFQWLDCDHPDRNACAFIRRGDESTVVAVCHFGDLPLEGYDLTLPGAGVLTLLLDSDWQCWGGGTAQRQVCVEVPEDGKLTLDLPPYSGRIYRFDAAKKA